MSTLDVSIIIPFKDKSEMTITCLESLHRYGDMVKEIILVSNNSSKAEKAAVERAVANYENAQLLTYDHPFNYQRINNWAVNQSSGKVVMLLNNDIELVPESAGLLKIMYNKALEPDSGAVGCVLLYEDRRNIQHGGIYLVPGQTADHLYVGQSLAKVRQKIARREYPYDITNNLQVSAVTAAALMVSRHKYDKIDGLNETFIICGGDVDLCLRLDEQHYKNWLIGADSGYMVHKESKSRSLLAVPYVDFVESYKSYIRHFDIAKGDLHLEWEKVSHAK